MPPGSSEPLTAPDVQCCPDRGAGALGQRALHSHADSYITMSHTRIKAAVPIAAGSCVRIKPGASPKYGWQGACRDSVGVVRNVFEPGSCLVSFPKNSAWVGLVGEVEEVKAFDDQARAFPAPKSTS